MAAPGNWQNLIERIVSKFSKDGRIDTFKKCGSQIDQISFVSKNVFLMEFDWISDFFNKCQTRRHKDLDRALRLKKEGTECFQKKKYKEAVQKYSEGILYVPWDSEELGILYGNRSAALFYLKKFENCLQDISQAKKCGFPVDKIYKIMIRETHCHIQLGNSTKAQECAKTLESYIEEMENDSKLKEERTSELMKLKDKMKTCCPNQQVKPSISIPCVSHGENMLLVQASKAVSIQYIEEKGRFLTASQDIVRGDTLIVEHPYAAVLLPENMESHCQHCFVKLPINYYPCRRCVSVKYCCEDCVNVSWKNYHGIECPYLKLLYSVGIAHLSLRVVITAGLNFLKCFMRQQSSIEKSQLHKGFDESGTYHRSYQSVYDLMTHSKDMDTEDLLQYTLTALLLLEVLKHSGWFKLSTEEKEKETSDNLHEDELLVGSLLLRHILQLVCNAHAITELKCTQTTESIVEDQSQVRIATAIYPTASLMNHSCDPSIIASFNKDILVVRAVKDIRKGEEVYNCYGPHHKRMGWDERQQSLMQQYFFTCKCIPCTEGEITSAVLYSYRCDKCEGPSVTEGLDKICCKHCQKSLSPDLISIRKADNLFLEGIKLLQDNRNKEAVDVMLNCCQIRERLLYKHNKVLSETQDCLARCYASIGKFEKSSKYLRRSIETVKVIYGADSIETGNELQKLSEILVSAHKWREALDCVCDAIEIFTENYGENHDTVKELSNMKEELFQVINCDR